MLSSEAEELSKLFEQPLVHKPGEPPSPTSKEEEPETENS